MTDPCILHVDMDAFYASVEVLRDPSLVGHPVIVGGSGSRGVVASCSYEARAFGVRSAMPSARARRLCPPAVFVEGSYRLYAEVSRRLHELLLSFTPLVEGISLDEAFLDVRGARRLFGPAPAIAASIRRRIGEELGLEASVGVGPTKLVAKLASKAAKPRPSPSGPRPGRGVVVISEDEQLAFLHRLPVTALWGVGPATVRRLQGWGVATIGDLAGLPAETLRKALGPAMGRHLHDLAWGRDPGSVDPARPAKSVGHEETFSHDLVGQHALRPEIVRLSDAVASRLRSASQAGRTVTLKLRFADFSTVTRSRTLSAAVDSGAEVARVAGVLLHQLAPSEPVRLVGVSVSNLMVGPVRQLQLGQGSAGWREVDKAVDELRDRFGEAAVGPAVLLGRQGLHLRRQGDQQWGPRADSEDGRVIVDQPVREDGPSKGQG